MAVMTDPAKTNSPSLGQQSQPAVSDSSAPTHHVFLPFAPARGGQPLPNWAPSVSPLSGTGDESLPGSVEYIEGYKLFVGCLPYEAQEDDLRPLFEKFGDIIELSIQRDKSGFSKGCAWLRYTTREACDDCIRNLHNQYYLGSVRSAIQVKYAAAEPSYSDGRVLLSGIPLHLSDSDVLAALSHYGEIVEYLPSRSPGAPTSDATLKMARPERASALVASIKQGSMVIAGYPCFSLHASFATKTVVTKPVTVSTRTPTYYSGTSPSNSVESFPLTQPLFPSVAASRFTQVRPPSIVTPSPEIPVDAMTPCKLFVGCLPYSKSAADLQELFEQFGPLLEAALLVNPDGKSKGAAFVTFAKRPDALQAQLALDGYIFPNSTRAINVSLATNQTWRGPPSPRDLPEPGNDKFSNVSGELRKPPGFGSPASSPLNRRA